MTKKTDDKFILSTAKKEKLPRKKANIYIFTYIVMPLLVIGLAIGLVFVFVSPMNAEYQILVTQPEHGQITSENSLSIFPAGSEVTYTITPDEGYEIASILVDGNPIEIENSGEGSITYTFSDLSANHTFTVNFRIKTFGITVVQPANGTIAPATIVKNYGDSQTFIFTPNLGYKITSITIDGETETVIDNEGTALTRMISNITAPHAITATFAIRTFTVIFDGNDGILVSGEEIQTIEYGNSAIPPVYEKEGYTFTNWLGDYTNITEDRTITAAYDINTFGISVNAGSGGTIVPDNPIVEYGEDITFTITPNIGYEIDEILIDGTISVPVTANPGNSQTYEFVNIQSSHTITATFKRLTFIITVNAGSNGIITPTTITKEYGTNQSFTITPSGSYEIESITVDGVAIQVTATPGYSQIYTFENIQDSHTINATFKLKLWSYDDGTGQLYYSGGENPTELDVPGTFGEETVESVDGSSIPDSVEILILPNTITTINPGEFSGISNLVVLTIDNDTYGTEDGAVYERNENGDLTTIIAVPAGKESIIFATTITIIGELAFENSRLLEIELPSTIEAVGANAFKGSSISAFGMTSSSTTLSPDALANMSSLEQIVVQSDLLEAYELPDIKGDYTISWGFEGDFVTTLQSEGIYTSMLTGYASAPSALEGWTYTNVGGNYYLTGVPSGSGTIVIPSQLNIDIGTNINIYGIGSGSIGSLRLNNILDYSIVIIENGINVIYDVSFNYCTNLTSVTIPGSITNIGVIAFDGCVDLQTVYFGLNSQLNSIGIQAFQNCSSLTSITIPNGVTNIGRKAFYGCSNLESISIPNSNATIDREVFMYCSNLTSVVLPNNITSIEDGIFSYCSSLTSITIPNSVTNIGIGVFSNCSSLTTISIPANVLNIGPTTFINCSSLTSIQVNSSNLNYSSLDGVLFNKIQTRLLAYPGGKTGDYSIPSSVTYISGDSFRGCLGLASVVIPYGVTEISNSTFLGSSLTSITIPGSVTKIGGNAFNGCTNLTSITIPSSVTSIETWAFAHCTELISITIESTSVLYYANILYDCPLVASIYVPSGLVGTYKSTPGWSEFASIIFPIP